MSYDDILNAHSQVLKEHDYMLENIYDYLKRTHDMIMWNLVLMGLMLLLCVCDTVYTSYCKKKPEKDDKEYHLAEYLLPQKNKLPINT